MADVAAARPWLSPVVVASCVALEMFVAAASLPVFVRGMAIGGLAAGAVAISLSEALGLRRSSRALRAVIGIPIALCVLTTVVLMLEADFRAALVLAR